MYNNTLNPIDSIPDQNNLEPEEQFENMTPNERVNLTNEHVKIFLKSYIEMIHCMMSSLKF